MVLSRELSVEQHMDKAFEAHDDSYNRSDATDADRIMLLQEATFHVQIANYKMMRKVTDDLSQPRRVYPSGTQDIHGNRISAPLVGAS